MMRVGRRGATRLCAVLLALLVSNGADARSRHKKHKKKRSENVEQTSLESSRGRSDEGSDSLKSMKKEGKSESAKGRKINAAGEIGYMYFAPGYGLRGAYQLTEKVELESQFFMANGEMSAGSDAMFNEYISINLMELDFLTRYFVWNSLNVSGGLGYAMISGDYGVTLGSTGNKVTAPYSATAILALLGVGNEWKFKNRLSVGVDWVTATYPVSTSVSLDKPSGSTSGSSGGISIDPYQGRDPSEVAAETIGKQMQFRIATVQVGYSF